MAAFRLATCRAERLGVALALLALLALHVWAAHYRIDPLDEGYFIYTSSRILAGELPYRDFSTPYTPAFFYLNAAVFRLFGMDLVTLRLSMTVARLGILLLMYLLARRIMPPAFALLPPLVLLAHDQIPVAWESHPAWWATLAFLASVWCVCRHRERGGLRWWTGAVAAAAIAFAFKQNLGLFAVAALVTLALAGEAELPSVRVPRLLAGAAVPLPRKFVGWLRRWLGPATLLALCAGVGWGIRTHLDPLLLVMFALPFGALALERLRGARCQELRVGGSADERLAATGIRLGSLGIVFTMLTLPWLLALLTALGPDAPLGAFVGAIDTAGYFLALELPRPDVLPVLGLVCLAPATAWAVVRPWPRWLRAGLLAGSTVLAGGLLALLMRPAAEVHPSVSRAFALLTVHATANLVLIMPSVAFWVAFGLLLVGRVPTEQRFALRWYLLSGSLLLLNQYPRIDEVHMLFSGPLLWIVGAYLLWRLFARASRGLAGDARGRLGRVALYLSLLGLPLAAAWPTLETRRQDLLTRAVEAPWALATPTYVPLGVPGASVFEIDYIGWKYPELRAWFARQSEPGERIFVYPASPLMYYLVDRPNATRFNHILPGLLSAADEREVIAVLDSRPVRYVVWDVFGAEYWGRPWANQALSEYIWDRYEPVDDIGGFLLMRRKG